MQSSRLGRRCVLGVIALTMLAGAAWGQGTRKKESEVLYRVSQGVLIGGAVFDFLSSAPTKHTREAGVMGNNRGAQAGFIFGTAALTFWTTHHAHRMGRRGAAIWGNMVVGGLHTGAGCWNVSLTMRWD